MPSLRPATCLDFEIIKLKQQFCGNTHSTVPSAHAGEGNKKYVKLSVHHYKMTRIRVYYELSMKLDTLNAEV